MSNLT